MEVSLHSYLMCMRSALCHEVAHPLEVKIKKINWGYIVGCREAVYTSGIHVIGGSTLQNKCSLLILLLLHSSKW